MSFIFSQLMPNRLTFIVSKKRVYNFTRSMSKWPPKLGVVFFGPPCIIYLSMVNKYLGVTTSSNIPDHSYIEEVGKRGNCNTTRLHQG